MRGCRSSECLPTDVGEVDERTATVVLAGLSCDEGATFHPTDLMGQPARGPQKAGGQLVRAPWWPIPLSECRQDVVVRLGETRAPRHVTRDLEIQKRPHPAVPPPRSLLRRCEPSQLFHRSYDSPVA